MESARKDIVTFRGTSQGPKGKEVRMWKLGGKGETSKYGAPAPGKQGEL